MCFGLTGLIPLGVFFSERDQVLPFFSPQPRCAVTMEACGVRTSAAARLASLDTNLKAENGNRQAAISRQARDAEVAGRLMMIAGISA